MPGTVSSRSFPPSLRNDGAPRLPHDDGDDDDGGASDRRDVIGEVVLAQLPGAYHHPNSFCIVPISFFAQFEGTHVASSPWLIFSKPPPFPT